MLARSTLSDDVAYALAKAGHSVALVEKGVVAGEQSSRNWGWCRLLNRDEREIPLMQHSHDLWDRLPGEIGADVAFGSLPTVTAGGAAFEQELAGRGEPQAVDRHEAPDAAVPALAGGLQIGRAHV